jgi:peptidoglycan/LPS O-acetylase OafA/YrhL
MKPEFDPLAKHRFLVIAFVLRGHQKLGLDTLHYLYIFYAGALLVFALLGLCLTGEFVPLHGHHPVSFDLPITCFGTLLVAVLAYGAIPTTRRFMRSRLIQFFGRISYSFYLINWLAVMSVGGLILRSRVIDQLGAFTTIWLVMLGSFAVNIVLSYVLHVLAERPSVALSRKLAAPRA